jgi:hypothetical protein
MKMYSKDGIEMMDIQSFHRNGAVLVMKGKMMGAMNTAVHIRPEDLWGAFRLMPWRVLLCLPWMLLKGSISSRRAAAPPHTGR